MDEFFPLQTDDTEARIRHIEYFLCQSAGRNPVDAAVNVQAAPFMPPPGGGGGAITLPISEFDVVFDPDAGHEHEGEFSHLITIVGDVSGFNNATTVDKFKNVPLSGAPVAADNQKFIQYNSPTTQFRYAFVTMSGDVSGFNNTSKVDKIKGVALTGAPVSGDDQKFIQFDKRTNRFRYSLVKLNGDVIGNNPATIVTKAKGIPLPTPVATDDSKVLSYRHSIVDYILRTLPVVQETVSTTPFTLTANQLAVWTDATAGSITINLPAAATNADRLYIIKKIDASANTVIVDGNASETIDGVITNTLTLQFQSISIICDGSNWFIV